MEDTKNTIEKAAGINWRTTLAGLTSLLAFLFMHLETIAAHLSANPALLDFMPTETRKTVSGMIALVSAIVFVIKSKDSNVSGNGSREIIYKVKEGDTLRRIEPLIIAALIPALLFSGCALSTDTAGNTRAEVRVTGEDLVSFTRAYNEYRRGASTGYAK